MQNTCIIKYLFKKFTLLKTYKLNSRYPLGRPNGEDWGSMHKVDVMYKNWKEVPTAQKDLMWEDIQVFFFSYLMFFNQ